MSRQAPLNWLRSFEAAARLNSFTRAAQELNLTQAAVSKQIRMLESQLNCQLFRRHVHGLELTEQGRHYWLETRDLVAQLDKVTAQLMARRQSHRVHVRCNISYSLLVLTEQLAGFRAIYPDIAVEISHDIWEPDRHSSNAHIEIGYCLLDGFTTSEDSRLLAAGSLFPVMADHFDPEQVAELPLIHVAGYYREWHWWVEQTERCPLNTLLADKLTRQGSRRDWYVDNSLMGYQLAAQGLGLALGREPLILPLLASGQLKQLADSSRLSAPEGFFIRLAALGKGHNATEKLFRFLTGAVEQVYPG